MTSTLWLLVRTEVLRLARTSEVVRYIVLPALLGPPVLLFVVVLATSMRGPRAVIALPADLPPELPLEEALSNQLLDVRVVDDPMAAWADGTADGAVVAWHDDLGVAGPTRGATAPRWRVEVVGDERWVADLLGDEAREWGDAWLADMVTFAGGDADRDLDVARLDILDDPDESPGISGARAVMAYTSFLLGLVSYLFLALPLVADRADGVTESMRALPVPPSFLVLARILAMGLLQLLVLLLIVLNVMLTLGPLARGEHFAVPGVGQLVTVAVCTAFVSSGYAAVGVHAPSVKVAGNLGTLVLFAHMGLLAWALIGQPPVFVPVAGVIAAEGGVAMGIGILSSGLATVLAVLAMGHQLSRRVELVLPRGGI